MTPSVLSCVVEPGMNEVFNPCLSTVYEEVQVDNARSDLPINAVQLDVPNYLSPVLISSLRRYHVAFLGNSHHYNVGLDAVISSREKKMQETGRAPEERHFFFLQHGQKIVEPLPECLNISRGSQDWWNTCLLKQLDERIVFRLNGGQRFCAPDNCSDFSLVPDCANLIPIHSFNSSMFHHANLLNLKVAKNCLKDALGEHTRHRSGFCVLAVGYQSRKNPQYITVALERSGRSLCTLNESSRELRLFLRRVDLPSD